MIKKHGFSIYPLPFFQNACSWWTWLFTFQIRADMLLMLWHSLLYFLFFVDSSFHQLFSYNSQTFCRHVYFSNVDEWGLVSRKYFRLASLGRQSKVTDKWRTQRNRWRLKKETLRAFKIWLDLYHSIFNMYNHSVTLYWAPMCCYFYLQTGFSRWYIRLLNNLRRYLDVRLLRQHFLLI